MTKNVMYNPLPSALAEYAIILSIYTLELDKREYQINQARLI